MVAGLAVQVASLLFFILLCSDLAWRVHKHKGRLNPKHSALHKSRTFKLFLCGMHLNFFECILSRRSQADHFLSNSTSTGNVWYFHSISLPCC